MVYVPVVWAKKINWIGLIHRRVSLFEMFASVRLAWPPTTAVWTSS